MKNISLSKLVSVVAVGAALSTFAPAIAAQDDDAPPVEVIATLSPVYFEGHPAYWWHNRWHYRDARGAWGYYRAEPAFLRDHRVAHPSERHYYAGGHAANTGGRRR